MQLGANSVYSIGNHPKNDWFVLSASRRIKLGWNGITTVDSGLGSELSLRFFSEKPVVFLPISNKMISLLLIFF